MQKTKLIAWIEVAAAVSVLFGLFLVAQELRQNNQYAKAESTRDLFQMWSEIYRFQTEQHIDELFSKSITGPSDLSDDELRKLDNYYWLVMNAELAQAAMARDGLTLGNQGDFARLIADSYFLSPYGRAWFDLNGEEFDLYSPDFRKTISDHLEATPIKTKDDYLDHLRSRF